jgi:ABC-type amino acid transport substrate-binding protein
VQEVLSGTCDVAIVDRVMAEGTLKGASFQDLQILDLGLGGEEEYAIGFRKGSPDTLEKVNAALKKLYANGKIQELAEKYAIAESLIPIE